MREVKENKKNPMQIFYIENVNKFQKILIIDDSALLYLPKCS